MKSKSKINNAYFLNFSINVKIDPKYDELLSELTEQLFQEFLYYYLKNGKRKINRENKWRSLFRIILLNIIRTIYYNKYLSLSLSNERYRKWNKEGITDFTYYNVKYIVDFLNDQNYITISFLGKKNKFTGKGYQTRIVATQKLKSILFYLETKYKQSFKSEIKNYDLNGETIEVYEVPTQNKDTPKKKGEFIKITAKGRPSKKKEGKYLELDAVTLSERELQSSILVLKNYKNLADKYFVLLSEFNIRELAEIDEKLILEELSRD